MNRNYFITLETESEYHPDLEVEITITDIDELSYNIDSIDDGTENRNDLLNTHLTKIEMLIDEEISQDDSLTADYEEYLDDRKNDMDFREFYEG